jgi:hypothetical protein
MCRWFPLEAGARDFGHAGDSASVPVAARPEEMLCAVTMNPTQVLHFASGLVVWIVAVTLLGLTL